jgi:hypothetical protein
MNQIARGKSGRRRLRRTGRSDGHPGLLVVFMRSIASNLGQSAVGLHFIVQQPTAGSLFLCPRPRVLIVSRRACKLNRSSTPCCSSKNLNCSLGFERPSPDGDDDHVK